MLLLYFIPDLHLVAQLTKGKMLSHQQINASEGGRGVLMLRGGRLQTGSDSGV